MPPDRHQPRSTPPSRPRLGHPSLPPLIPPHYRHSRGDGNPSPPCPVTRYAAGVIHPLPRLAPSHPSPHPWEPAPSAVPLPPPWALPPRRRGSSPSQGPQLPAPHQKTKNQQLNTPPQPSAVIYSPVGGIYLTMTCARCLTHFQSDDNVLPSTIRQSEGSHVQQTAQRSTDPFGYRCCRAGNAVACSLPAVSAQAVILWWCTRKTTQLRWRIYSRRPTRTATTSNGR